MRTGQLIEQDMVHQRIFQFHRVSENLKRLRNNYAQSRYSDGNGKLLRAFKEGNGVS